MVIRPRRSGPIWIIYFGTKDDDSLRAIGLGICTLHAQASKVRAAAIDGGRKMYAPACGSRPEWHGRL
jgi:hypothetical protein